MRKKVLFCLVLLIPASMALGSGIKAPNNISEDLANLTFQADEGDASAQCAMGFFYLGSHGIPANPAQATALFREAAMGGDVVAMYNYAVVLQQGLGTRRNSAEAARWYLAAAQCGLACAQYNLGHLYETGEGLKKDYSQAAFWYAKASRQSDADAQVALGILHFYGLGVALDREKAMRLYQAAARQGHPQARNNLALAMSLN
jgi:TPR repeat protein